MRAILSGTSYGYVMNYVTPDRGDGANLDMTTIKKTKDLP